VDAGIHSYCTFSSWMPNHVTVVSAYRII
jgi:hypothetical protein